MNEFLIIGIISFTTSILSGMLGLGGAVILIPAYIYIPPLFGLEPFDVKLIAGMTSVQVFSSALTGILLHRKRGFVNNEIILKMGIPLLIASFLGAILSKALDPDIILGVFAFMALFGSALMIRRNDAASADLEKEVRIKTIPAVIMSAVVGFFGGIAGAPGAFILAPLMITILKIPIRITIGSTLGIVLLSAGSVSIGKLITGQVPPVHTIIAVLATIPGVWLGSMLSYQLNVRALRLVLAFLITAVGIEMWFHIFFP